MRADGRVHCPLSCHRGRSNWDARLGWILWQADHAMLGRRGVGAKGQLQHPRRMVERCLGGRSKLYDVQKMGDLAGKVLRQFIRERRELDWLRPAMELVYQPGSATGQAAMLGGDLEMPAADRVERPAGDDLADGARGKADQKHAGIFCRQLLDREAIHHRDRKSTRLNSSHANISYAVFCLKKKKKLPSLSCYVNQTTKR